LSKTENLTKFHSIIFKFDEVILCMISQRIFHFYLNAHCTDLVVDLEDEWPPNLPDFSTLDHYVWGAMLQTFYKLNSKPKPISELKSVLQRIWNDLPQTIAASSGCMRFGRW